MIGVGDVAAGTTETDTTLTESGTFSVTDADINDTVSATVESVEITNGGTFDGTVPAELTANSNQVLQNMLSLSSAADTSALNFANNSFLEANSTGLTNTAEFTISLWMNPDRVNKYGADLVGQDNCVEMTMINDRLRMWTPVTGNRYFNSSRAAITAGQWTHITVTGDAAAGQMKLYADGELLETWNHGSKAHYGQIGSLPKNPRGQQGFQQRQLRL